MSGTRSQYARWKEIISILGHGGKVTAERLAMELEVSVRTIQRDLDALRHDHQAPIAFDSSRRTLFLEETEWQLRPLRLTESELFHLVIAAGMAGQFRGTPIAAGLSNLFRKLETVLIEPIDLDPELIAGKVSFHGGHPRPIKTEVWRTLVGGLRNSRVLQIAYQASGYPKPATMEVEPVHLACRMGDWYLLARREGFQDTRTYALSRIHHAQVMRRHFPPHPADSHDAARMAFARFVAQKGKTIRARVRFTAESAEWIREREWHPDQVISEHRDGGLTIALPIDGDKEALAWVLSWGAQAKVVGPKWLKERVVEEVRAMARLR